MEDIYSPHVPFSTHIPGGMFPNKIIAIKAHLPYDTSRFMINLQTGPSEHDDIVFHFNGRMDQKTIVRNTRRGGVWESEERDLPHGFGLRHGDDIEIMIKACFDHFAMTVDGAPLTKYSYRMPVTSAVSLRVEGDIHIRHVKFIEE